MSVIFSDADDFNQNIGRSLPRHLGITAVSVGSGRAVFRLAVTPDLLAPNGYLHAGSVVTLADSAAGFGCLRSLPDGATSFTTIELKSNLMGTAREGAIVAEASIVHAGRMTQVWEAIVRRESDDKVIARFSCTQMILYP